ncbi:GNAT family N-acetyltransferase [Rhizobiales bacterium RZME27]|uniref:GNAT family N-acetyltransferase n=1 Tax=Endobacterium cereale TaxID=2663029 RepID=A0A6A8ACF0_9HYPH|nr:GNAT family N-acetyltransferase [Endobacterium cereale]MEB2843997.1 GNAT family N-acetyltransferase [Endobacterium cereale]MQY48409.1 GNAT family N-acetyltransferase [Endobacterium cereale]
MQIRTAIPADAPAMSAMLQLLVQAGKRISPADEAFVLSQYISNPDGIRCSLAIDDGGSVLGLQSLIFARDGNRYETPVGWGIIGTHVSPLAARRGVGRQLFEVTKRAAAEAGLAKIEAFIGEKNAEGQAYYEKMGFVTYRLAEGAVCKRFELG